MVGEYPKVKALPKESEEGTTIMLHYVGKRYYTMETFIKEAMKHDVSRALPISVVKKLHWGDKIFLAFDMKSQKGRYALVFGYFYVQGLNVSNPEIKKKVNEDERIKVVKRVTFGGGGIHVTRGCGDYSISAVSYVDNDVSEIAEVIDDIAKKEGIKVKVMVAGMFVRLSPVKLYDAPFTRSIAYVKVPDEFFDLVERVNHNKMTGGGKTSIAYLENYKLGKPSKRRKKRVKEVLKTKSLTNWLKNDEGRENERVGRS